MSSGICRSGNCAVTLKLVLNIHPLVGMVFQEQVKEVIAANMFHHIETKCYKEFAGC